MWNLEPRLEGEIVILEPLSPEHFDALLEASRPPEIWRWWTVDMSSEAAFRVWFEAALAAREDGVRAHFATLDAREGRPIGSTSFMNLRPEHAGLEIGWTWLSPPAWRTAANAEAKLMMLRHAFESLGCQRVEFRTHASNERSRAALEALPAQFEGIARDDRILHDGSRRSSAVYSILDREWPAVAASLTARVAAASAARAAG
ncbi:MAG: GNAT family protein [Solirubrobacteraceae bacterium]